MIEVKLTDVQGHLEELIAEAAAGEDVIITSVSGSAIRLVALPKDENAGPPTSAKAAFWQLVTREGASCPGA